MEVYNNKKSAYLIIYIHAYNKIYYSKNHFLFLAEKMIVKTSDKKVDKTISALIDLALLWMEFLSSSRGCSIHLLKMILLHSGSVLLSKISLK